jgi:hypothetical protein
VTYDLTVAKTYDAIGVVRVLPDGIQPMSLKGIQFVLDQLSVSNGKISGTITPKGSIAPAVPLSGTFDAKSGMIVFDSVDVVLTGTASETIDQLGGRADDLLPKDGIADEISGYIETDYGSARTDGTFLGTQRQDVRPAAPMETKVHIMAESPGAVRVIGDPGAVMQLAGVEVFRFQVAQHDPVMTLGQAEKDGSFSVNVAGTTDDAFIVRARVAGIASDGAVFRAH